METTEDVPVGFGGLEIYGYDALLRSLVILPPVRGVVVDPRVGLRLRQRVEGRDHRHAEPVLQRVGDRPRDPVVRVEDVGAARSAQPALGGVDELVVEPDEVVLEHGPPGSGVEIQKALTRTEGAANPAAPLPKHGGPLCGPLFFCAR